MIQRAENKKLEAAVDLLADYGGFDRDYLKDKLLINSSKEKPDNKNKMAEIAKLFGKELDEEFTVESWNKKFRVKFTVMGIDVLGYDSHLALELGHTLLIDLLTSRAVILNE